MITKDIELVLPEGVFVAKVLDFSEKDRSELANIYKRWRELCNLLKKLGGRNINLPEGVKPTINDRDFVVATLVPPTVEVETKPAEEAESVTIASSE